MEVLLFGERRFCREGSERRRVGEFGVSGISFSVLGVGFWVLRWRKIRQNGRCVCFGRLPKQKTVQNSCKTLLVDNIGPEMYKEGFGTHSPQGVKTQTK